MVVNGLADLMGVAMISVSIPFIFDRRAIPEQFEGYYIRSSVDDISLPREFQIDEKDESTSYVWAPERYEKFVVRCADEIRQRLDNPTMTRKEMLDALVGWDFDDFKNHIYEAIERGTLPPYRE